MSTEVLSYPAPTQRQEVYSYITFHKVPNFSIYLQYNHCYLRSLLTYFGVANIVSNKSRYLVHISIVNEISRYLPAWLVEFMAECTLFIKYAINEGIITIRTCEYYAQYVW